MIVIFVSPTSMLVDNVSTCDGASCVNPKMFDFEHEGDEFKATGCGSVLTMNKMLGCLSNKTKFTDEINDTYVFLYSPFLGRTFTVSVSEGEVPFINPLHVNVTSVWGDGADAFFHTASLLNAGVIDRDRAHDSMRAIWFGNNHRVTRDFVLSGYKGGDYIEPIDRTQSSKLLCSLMVDIGLDGGHFHAD